MSSIKAKKASVESPIKPRPQQKCPACHRLMNICTEAKDLYYCPECGIHLKDGQAVTVDKNGNFKPALGYVNEKPRLTVVKKVEPQNIDIYFNSGNKKAFRGVLAHWPHGQWIVLKKQVPDKSEGIDFYFTSGNKKQFKGVDVKSIIGTWILLEKPSSREISVNSHNVNWFETETEIHINGNNVNYLEEM